MPVLCCQGKNGARHVGISPRRKFGLSYKALKQLGMSSNRTESSERYVSRYVQASQA